jgi:hypothetical protein
MVACTVQRDPKLYDLGPFAAAGRCERSVATSEVPSLVLLAQSRLRRVSAAGLRRDKDRQAESSGPSVARAESLARVRRCASQILTGGLKANMNGRISRVLTWYASREQE